MRALTVIPLHAGSAAVTEMPEPEPGPGELLVDGIALGVCGTDREIAGGEYGWAPPGSERLILPSSPTVVPSGPTGTVSDSSPSFSSSVSVTVMTRPRICSPKPNVRYGARKILQQTCEAAADVGAAGVFVPPGPTEAGISEGVGRWTRTLEMLESKVPVLLENTAGGENAVARRFDALAMLWEAISAYDGPVEVGFCLDTCHAHAAGEELSDAVERALAITGRLDLLHANDSRDPPGTGADRHARLGEGKVDPEALRGMIRAGGKTGAPIIVETPGPRAGLRADLDFVRAALEKSR